MRIASAWRQGRPVRRARAVCRLLRRRGARGAGRRPMAFGLPLTRAMWRSLVAQRAVLAKATALWLALTLVSGAAAQTALPIPSVSVGLGSAKRPEDVAVTLQVMLLLTVLTLAPSILIMTTAFTRIVIVLSILRSAIGIPNVPPNQVLVGLALFMTFFVMRPVLDQINREALEPYFAKKIAFQDATARAITPLRGFMIRQTYKKDLTFFINLARMPRRPATASDVPISVVIPAFITSELKTAFIIGFYIYLPFLVIDLVVASTMMSMGMMMLPPTLIALPAKILLFVLADGWSLLLGSLAKGFR
jgi:flagellar biosynthetic protein FliP